MTVILVPWRTDDGHRAKVWEVCRRRWTAQFPDWPIYEGCSPEGPFNRSAAINDAARQAGTWDTALIIDADVMLPDPNVRKAVARASKTGRVTWAHRRWRELKEDVTERLLGPKSHLYAPGILGDGGIESGDLQHLDVGGKPVMDQLVSSTTNVSWSCCIAVRRDAWDTIGGFDERFIGWGHEDSSFSAVAGAFVGWDRIEGDVLNLYHPRSAGNGMAARDAQNRWTPQALRNGRLGMRYMIALRRDYGLADRAVPVGPDVIARDIANLTREDEAFAAKQNQEARKEFDDWWPTLDELRDGAKAYREDQAQPKVSVVVHTGGKMEAWPERREYLRESVASLVEKVTGPIVQRVIYDCWGDAGIRSWLTEEFGPLGFYVVGPNEPVDYTGSMQAMWRYLRKRAKGEYVFMAEDDFTYERPVDLYPMIEALAQNPHLIQVALLRDAFYQDEQETGGILGWPEPAFDRKADWLEHALFFTANPSLFRRALTNTPWPSGKHSETIFGKQILADKRNRMAFWGQGEEWIRHIGRVRAGVGY